MAKQLPPAVSEPADLTRRFLGISLSSDFKDSRQMANPASYQLPPCASASTSTDTTLDPNPNPNPSQSPDPTPTPTPTSTSTQTLVPDIGISTENATSTSTNTNTTRSQGPPVIPLDDTQKALYNVRDIVLMATNNPHAFIKVPMGSPFPPRRVTAICDNDRFAQCWKSRLFITDQDAGELVQVLADMISNNWSGEDVFVEICKRDLRTVQNRATIFGTQLAPSSAYSRSLPYPGSSIGQMIDAKHGTSGTLAGYIEHDSKYFGLTPGDSLPLGYPPRNRYEMHSGFNHDHLDCFDVDDVIRAQAYFDNGPPFKSVASIPEYSPNQVYLKPPSRSTQHWTVAVRSTVDSVFQNKVDGTLIPRVTLVAPVDSPHGAVSQIGDSGSVVLNASYHPVGMITSGFLDAKGPPQDMTYVLSFDELLPDIEKRQNWRPGSTRFCSA
ncbi:hypothetical protein DL98DRAFT_594119 [Cadophora sp. DSE1049]|nr:hypothetical protein DL98DRAFT_594119 [Cadophora sp. DSE1049]